MIELIPTIKALGLIGIFLVIFSESGLLFGVFFPGDSLLFSAGLIASGGFFNINTLIIVCMIAAILGDSAGYWMGVKVGRKILYRDNIPFLRKKYVEKAEAFYQRYGVVTIIIGRFIPIIRTLAPVIAGVGKMHYRTFVFYNIIGGILWVLLLTLSGYFLGKVIPNPDSYILPIIIGIVFMSFLPLVYKYIRWLFRRDS
ncbi:MAG: VTT domain-containing protein [Patescibacteria group bacterium]